MMFQKNVRVISVLILVAIILLFPKFQALAQEEYPNRTIEVVSPWEAGSTTDLGFRFFAEKWAEFLGKPVVVINRAGGGGALGARFVAHAKPDGYTLLGASESAVISAGLEREDLGYNLDSFRNLFTTACSVLFYSVKFDSRWQTLNDFLKEAKNNPFKLKYATLGAKQSSTMVTEMLSKLAGVELTIIPFGSSAKSLIAVTGGNADIAVTWGLSGMAKSGLIRVLAVTFEERLSNYPEVPTLKELGYPVEYTRNLAWLAAPRQTPEKVLLKLIEAHNKVIIKYSKEIKEKLPPMGQYPVFLDEKSTTEELKNKEKLLKNFMKESR